MPNRALLVTAPLAFVLLIAAARANDIGVQLYIQPKDEARILAGKKTMTVHVEDATSKR